MRLWSTFQVHLQIARLEAENVFCAPPSNDGPDAREELGKGERLDKVIVCSGIEPDDAVFHRVPGREDAHPLAPSEVIPSSSGEQPVRPLLPT